MPRKLTALLPEPEREPGRALYDAILPLLTDGDETILLRLSGDFAALFRYAAGLAGRRRRERRVLRLAGDRVSAHVAEQERLTLNYLTMLCNYVQAYSDAAMASITEALDAHAATEGEPDESTD